MGVPQYQAFITALQFKVFSHLTQPKTSNDLSSQLKTDPNLTAKLLNALTSMGLLEKYDNNYINTTISKTFLVEGKNLYQGDVFEFWGDVLNRGIFQFPEILKTGKFPTLAFDEKRLEINTQGVKAGVVQKVIDFMLSLPGFHESRKALDLGGGPGIFSMALASANPNLKVTLVEYPPIAKFAEKSIQHHNMEGAVEVMPGDMVKDDIGQGYDLVFVSECLYFVKNDLTTVFKKIRKAMNPNATLICRHMVLTNDETSPQPVVFQNLIAEIVGIKDYASFREDDIPDALSEAGFSKIDMQILESMSNPYTVHIAQI
jgi:predicted O-methyltransferase YrrM